MKTNQTNEIKSFISCLRKYDTKCTISDSYPTKIILVETYLHIDMKYIFIILMSLYIFL